jgi:hypothetical protein
MKEIMVKDYINGDTAVSYDDGQRCLNDIKIALDQKEDIQLNFAGINYIITAFLNPVIGDLILEYGDEIMKFIQITNANMNILKKIKLVKEGSLLKREDMEE